MKILAFIFLSLCASGAFSEDQKLFTHHGEWDKGFESLRIGMTIPELTELRPNAKVSEFDLADMREDDPRRIDLDRSELIRDFFEDGVNLMARYTITNQKVEKVLLIWVGPLETANRLRASFVQFCTDNFGKEFHPEAVQQNATGPERHIAPLLCWTVGPLSVGASCTPDTEGLGLKHGSFTLSIGPDDETTFCRQASKKSVELGIDDVVRQRVFKDAGIAFPDTTKSDKLEQK